MALQRTTLTLASLAGVLLLSGCIGSDSSSDNKTNTVTEPPAQDSAATSLKSVPEYTDRMYDIKYGSNFDLGTSQSLVNYEAPITGMCYTKHDQQYNPCYVCHQDIIEDGRANRMNDGYLQNEYGFSDYGFSNHWTNLFADRSNGISAISDSVIDDYVNTENYSALAGILAENEFAGFIPDLEDYHLGADAFYDDGFAKDGSGWVAFNYKPLPSTFWPVNGSTDDVLIRLAKNFRQTADGAMSVTAYKFNLAIVEAAVKNLESVAVDDLNESIVGVDLNGDGVMGVVDSINRPTHYVGNASATPVETFLYPQYTEFMHSVRYIGATEAGEIYNAPRMKELRYMIKYKSYEEESAPMTKYEIARLYDAEFQEKEKGDLPFYSSNGEKGLDNGFGWWVQGFIEDADGALRPQTYEESFYCMGCHTTLGTTIDQTFAFARKMDGPDGWGYIDLKSMLDAPNVGEEEGEILTYFKRVGGGSEFRAHNDIHAKFYDNGVLDEEAVKNAVNVYELITPTRESALRMNKSYKVVVESQDYLHGREGNDRPVQNVYDAVSDTTPTLPEAKQYEWDIRLDWSKVEGE